MNMWKYLGVLATAVFLVTRVQAQHLQKTAPKYDEQEVQRLFKVWVDGLDSLYVSANYKKPVKDLLSADEGRQFTAIEALGNTGDIRVIPWLFPFLDQDTEFLRNAAGRAIEKVISSFIYQRPDGRVERAASLKPTAWIALKLFRKPDVGNSWEYASKITWLLRMKEFEDELTTAAGSKNYFASRGAKSALAGLKGTEASYSYAIPLEANLSLTRSTFTLGELIEVKLTLTNVSSEPVSISAPWYFASAADGRTTVDFLITTSDGRKLRRHFSAATGGVIIDGPPSIRIKPGDNNQASFDLVTKLRPPGHSLYVYFDEENPNRRKRTIMKHRLPPGSYRLRMKYYHSVEQAEYDESHSDWIGEVISNEVSFSVLPRKS